MKPTDANRDRPTATEQPENRPAGMRPAERSPAEMRPTEMRSNPERPTETPPTENRPPKTMGEISHRNPFTGETAGQFFNRGPIVRADGGRTATAPERTDGGNDEARAADEEASNGDDEAANGDDESSARMRDVDHTPPKEAADANRVFERGGREESVESEE